MEPPSHQKVTEVREKVMKMISNAKKSGTKGRQNYMSSQQDQNKAKKFKNLEQMYKIHGQNTYGKGQSY